MPGWGQGGNFGGGSSDQMEFGGCTQASCIGVLIFTAGPECCTGLMDLCAQFLRHGGVGYGAHRGFGDTQTFQTSSRTSSSLYASGQEETSHVSHGCSRGKDLRR